MIRQSAGEKFAEMTPMNNVSWSYFRINCIETLIDNLKSLEPLKYCKAISGFSFCPDLSNYA
jgi:hypothetical protein